MAVFNNILAGASGATGAAGYEIERSLRFNSDDSAYLNRTPSSAGNRKTWTWSGWVKRSGLGDYDFLFMAQTSSVLKSSLSFWNGDYLRFKGDYNDGTARNFSVSTDALFRDPSAWYHVVCRLDTTQATEADRIKIWVNGVEQTFISATYPTQNSDIELNNNSAHLLGSQTSAPQNGLDGYLADVHFIDGQALAASDFGEYDADTGVWNPIEFTGSHNVTSGYSGTVPNSVTEITPTGPNGNGVALASLLFGGTELTVSQNYIRQDGGGFEWSAAIPLSSGDVAGAKCLYFNNTSNHDIEFKIDGSWVTVQTNANNVIGSTQGQGAIITYTASGSVNWTGVRATNGSNVSVTSVSGIFVNNDLVGSGVTGVNGFHLDFSDNSSNAALGTDSSGNSNDWTVNNLKAVDNFGISSAASITSLQTISFPITYAATVTYEFFVQVTNAVTYTYFAEETSASVWNVGINASGDLLFGNYTGGWTTFSSTGLADGSWHFVRLTTTGSSTSLYKDGTLLGTNASGGNVATSYSQITNRIKNGAFKIAHLRITTGGTPPTTGIPAISSMNQAAGTGGTLVFYDALDDIASSGTKTSDGGNVTITMAAATAVVSQAGVDSLIDTPTNYEASSGNNGGNYATLNPLVGVKTAHLTDGNLSQVTASGWSRLFPTLMPKTGKWYVECLQTNYAYGVRVTNVGVSPIDNINITSASKPGSATDEVAYETQYKRTLVNNSADQSGFPTYVSNDIIGVAIDLDNRTVQFYLNNSAMGTATTFPSTTKDYTFIIGCTGSNAEAFVNFGQRPFAYTPPTGYKSLCTTNLPDPTIADGSTAFDTKLYNGNGSSQTISGMNFGPDLIWSKIRSSTGKYRLTDIVRGTTNALRSDGTDAEFADTNVTAFNSDGFDIGANGNASGSTYVAWTWDAGTSNTSISAGSLNSSVYNQDANWSATSSVGSPSNAFDGSLSTGGPVSSSGSAVTITTSSFTARKIRLYKNGNNDPALAKITVNGTDYTFPQQTTATGWVEADLGSSTTVTTFTTTWSAGAYTLYAVEADGKILVDTTATPPNSPSIASTVRANPSAGFSIVSYTGNATSGSTVGHGLNAAPKMVIYKNRDDSSDWRVYNTMADGSLDILYLNTIAAKTDSGLATFTNSVFTVGGSNDTNGSGDDIIAYCFAPVEGYSAFGSYEGNGSSDGPFVYTGFRPKFVIHKCTSSAGTNWNTQDATRDPYNASDSRLFLSNSIGEVVNSAYDMDFLSNGFKIRTTHTETNVLNQTYLFIAFAEHPFKTSRAR
jgi:hypothetical protein